jgi:histidyl-tRNA synthetase
MAGNKPSIPRGTRDFNPSEMVRRNYIFETIKKVFVNYGFLPIETPALENLETLLGKYGEEGDKLLYRVLNSGDFLTGVDEEDIKEKNSAKLAGLICDRGLRYDLTVPFARYVVQHRNEITFPFKRFQVQPVWRADRPQKGRYREFYQCDADIIGSDSLINEAEFISIIDTVFKKLKIPVLIKLNNRKILSGIAEILDAADKITDLTVAIDKIDKIGKEKVKEELVDKGFSKEQINKMDPFFDFQGSSEEKLEFLEKLFKDSDKGRHGVDEIRETLQLSEKISLENELEIDLSLARGLNYYTGAIIEVKAKNLKIGSICGGGRYDDLTGIFGLPGVSGVGISFGADRIYDVMDQTRLFPETTQENVKIMFVNFGKKESEYILPLLMKLREQSINSVLYPDAVKMKKQFSWADASNIPYVAIIGNEEMKNERVTLKHMVTGDQVSITPDALIKKLTQ